MDWFRSHHGAPADVKLTLVAMRTGQHRAFVTAVWWEVLDHASQAVPRGSLANLDPDLISISQSLDINVIKAILKGFEEKGLIKDNMLANWHKRQPKREDSSAARTKSWRDAKKVEETTPESGVTQCDAGVTQCDDRTEQRRQEQSRVDSWGFSGKIIKITTEQFSDWKTNFYSIPDLQAELYSLDQYYFQNGNRDWFARTVISLKKAHDKWLTAPKPPPQNRQEREFKANVQTL